MTIELTIIISIISVAIAILSFLKTNKRSDTKDIEEKVRHDTKVDTKLDEISRGVNDIKYDVSTVKKDLQKHSERIILVEKSTDKAHQRIDYLCDILDLAKKEGASHE